MNLKGKRVRSQRCPQCHGKKLNPIVRWPISGKHKVMKRPTPMWASLTTRCLLFSWLCFGGLELLERLHVMPEVEDLDEVAPLQVASGLKSAVSSHDTSDPNHTVVANTVVKLAVWLPAHTIRQFGRLMKHAHIPSSLRLHQQLSVYRI